MSKTKALHDFVPDQIWHSYLKSKYSSVEKKLLKNQANRNFTFEAATRDISLDIIYQNEQ